MDIRHPFLVAWIAILKDGTQRQRSLAEFCADDKSFLLDLDTTQVNQFWYIDALGNKVYGVDVRQQLFLINGCLVQLPLPKGEYQLIAFSRTRSSTGEDDPKVRVFSFGLQATFNKENVKRVLNIHPDSSVIVEDN